MEDELQKSSNSIINDRKKNVTENSTNKTKNNKIPSSVDVSQKEILQHQKDKNDKIHEPNQSNVEKSDPAHQKNSNKPDKTNENREKDSFSKLFHDPFASVSDILLQLGVKPSGEELPNAKKSEIQEEKELKKNFLEIEKNEKKHNEFSALMSKNLKPISSKDINENEKETMNIELKDTLKDVIKVITIFF